MKHQPEMVVVLPTRNRSTLLPNAIRSVLTQQGGNFQVLVSDNSTSPEESSAIAALCRSTANRQLHYVRPPQSLSMAAHWEWALQHAMDRFNASHFTFVSSRWVVRPGGFAKLWEHIVAHPDVVLTYDDDMVLDDPGEPIRLLRKSLTGRLLRIDSAHLLYLCSLAIFPSCLPRMLNCILPRSVANTVKARFGSLFSSTAPDHALAYRCLAVIDYHQHLDEAILIQYGVQHSTGTGMFFKQPNPACADFKKTAGSLGLAQAAPIPKVEININVAFHEYSLVRQLAGDRLPEIDYNRYLQALANEVALLEDENRRQEYTRILRDNGWRGEFTESVAVIEKDASVTVTPFRVRMGMLFGQRPSENDNQLAFRNLEEALWFAGRFPKKHVPGANHLGYLQTGWRLGA